MSWTLDFASRSGSSTRVMLVLALLPIGCALGCALDGAPVAWLPVGLVTACLGLATAMVQSTYEHETGRRRHAHLIVRLAMLASVGGIAYGVEPWAESFTVGTSMMMQIGCSIVAGVASAVGWVLHTACTTPAVRAVVVTTALAPVFGVLVAGATWFATVPLAMLWLEDWFPASHREPFALVLGAAFAGIGMLIHWLVTRSKR